MPEAPWWQTAVIYQIYPRSFQDSNGDGIGDLPGISSRLEYLSDVLGVDAVWLSPFYRSPMADFGYDISNHCDVDPIFGTLDDFDHLVAEAHRRGLRVIIDFVPNHTSNHHPWFLESRSSRKSPRRDWYFWRDPKPNGYLPNNWLSVFGGPAWTWDTITGQYYLHSFLAEQPDLNWRNPEVREAMLNVVRFWLDREVDGFRVDVAHFIGKDPELRDNPIRPPTAANPVHSLGEFDRLDHINDMGHSDVHDMYRAFRAVLDSYQPERYSVGEIHEFNWRRWASYYGEKGDELHMPFNFALIYCPWESGYVSEVVASVESVLPEWAWPNYVLGNHDEPRLVTRIGRVQARAAALLLLTLRGTPTIYYGEELGMPQVRIPPQRVQDPWGIRQPVKGRDGARTPMQWTPEGGFTTSVPWLPYGDLSVNVADQREDPQSSLSLYRSLLAYRRSSQALRLGSLKQIEDLPPGCFGYRRAAGSETLEVMVNLSAKTIRLPNPRGKTVFSSIAEPSEDLAPFEARLLEPT